jgi:magnesium transporter
LPWLAAGMLGGILIAKIIGRFEATLSENLILAAFIPLIVYMSDAVGTQMEAFIIRDLATDPGLNFFRYLFRQISIVLIIGLIISAGLFAVSNFFHGDMEISLVLSISMLAAIMSSVITGLCVPFLFSKLSFDPANASGPLATIIQDTLSVFIYFTVATALL